MSQDFYKLLEVAADASPEEIQKAYRRLARKYHPDLNPDDKSAQQKFKDIQNAYDVLNDPEKRKMYDQFGPDFHRMGGDPFGGGAYPGGGGAYPGGGGAYPGGGGEADYEKYFRGGGAGPQGGFGFGSLDELLKQFGGGARTGGRGRGQTASPATQGADLRTELAVPFQTAALGGTAALNVVRGGKEETIQIKIPPGVTSGKKMRLRGQGNPGSFGGPNGDLIVLLHVAPHPHFRRNGNNLELSLPISLKEAIMGATVDVPTPNGTVALKIPPGSSGGRRLRIRGQGALSSSGPPGDLYVELQIRLPERLLESEQRSPELQNALDQLDSMYREPMRKHIQW
jgi:DnaJ-class molecular chaperone